jgi:hemerythrin-like domain-containing protein
MTATSQDVTTILTNDHHEVLDLIGQIASAPADQQRDMADTVIAELMRHSVAEEMYVYPVIADEITDGKQKVEHDKQEHQELEETMKELESLEPGDARFLEVVGRLQEQVRHHATDEENTQFPELRSSLSQDRLVHMGEQVERAKMAAPTRPHPAAPHSELFHKLAGPGVGLVDRLRDSLTGRSNKA